MIEHLDGMHETPNYRKNAHICLYRNDLAENYPFHWHTPIEILMPVENSYVALIGREKIVVKPHDILFINSGVLHAFEAPASGIRYFLQADMSLIRDISGINFILSTLGDCTHFTADNSPAIHESLVSVFTDICEMYAQLDTADEAVPADEGQESAFPGSIHNSFYEPIIYSKLLTMLTLIGNSHINSLESQPLDQSRKMEYVGKFMTICNYIEEHYAEDILLEDMAELASYSKFHFSRLFKQFTGVTFYKYVNQKRIAHAEEMLIDPDIPITQVAIRSGFSSPSAFIRMFKLIKGCTPTEFRKFRENQSFLSL